MKKIVGIIILSLLLAGLFILSNKYVLAPEEEFSPEIKKEEKKPITLLFVGDIMMDRGVRSSIVKNFGGDYNALFFNTPYLKNADIAFANLEGPVAVSGRKVGSRFSFRMDPESILAMREAGFDIVSFANNHVGDYTKEAFDETRTRLTEANILYAGAGDNSEDASTVRIINVRGLRVGFLGASDVGPEWMKATQNGSGILLVTDPHMAEKIAIAKKSVDILVVSFHFGSEYSPANDRQIKIAHDAVDAGADIVVGHHPHVMQKVELYNSKVIFYSLGNFIFDQYFSVHTQQGMVAEVNIDPETKVLTAKQYIVPISRQFIPQDLKPFSESDLITKTFTP